MKHQFQNCFKTCVCSNQFRCRFKIALKFLQLAKYLTLQISPRLSLEHLCLFYPLLCPSFYSWQISFKTFLMQMCFKVMAVSSLKLFSVFWMHQTSCCFLHLFFSWCSLQSRWFHCFHQGFPLHQSMFDGWFFALVAIIRNLWH